MLLQLMTSYNYNWVFCYWYKKIMVHPRINSIIDAMKYIQHVASNLDFSIFSSVQSRLTLWDPMDCSTSGLLVHHQLPEFTQTHVHWVGDAIQPPHLPSFPSSAFNLFQHQGISNESVFHIRWPKYWSFSFNISPSNEYSGLISFRMDWLDHLAVQGTLKSLLQHHSSKASIFLCSTFFMVQLSHPHMTTGKS